MSNRHKHADLIHAWAEGAEIEHRILSLTRGAKSTEWVKTLNPDWRMTMEYRIKPIKKADVICYYKITENIITPERRLFNFNLKCTLDGETGKLIKAEVL